MSDYTYDGPLTASDLRVAADALDEIEAVPNLAANKGIGRIEAVCDDSLIGHFQRFDESSPEMGWGFRQAEGS